MFKEGTVIKTASGCSVIVKEHYKSDDVFDYYNALYSLCPCILKWYKAPGKHHRRLHKNLRLLSKMDYPYPYTFLWPIDVTKIAKGSFGIITETLPDKYEPICDAAKKLNDKEKCECCIELIKAFQQLGKTGCSYYTFSTPHNIYLNTENKKNVIIGNCEEVAAPKAKILDCDNDPRYTAPELRKKLNSPSDSTDTFSLAVVLFKVMFDTEPFVYNDSEELQFIFESDTTISYPKAKDKWNASPKDVQTAFESVFARDAMHDPVKRCSADKLKSVFYSWQRQLYNGFGPFYILCDTSCSMSKYMFKPWRYRKHNKKKNLFSRIFNK